MKKDILNFLDVNKKEYYDLSDKIHEFAEIAGEEHNSCKLLCDFLTDKGFVVTTPIGSQDATFIARYGSGDVNIGFIAFPPHFSIADLF